MFSIKELKDVFESVDLNCHEDQDKLIVPFDKEISVQLRISEVYLWFEIYNIVSDNELKKGNFAQFFSEANAELSLGKFCQGHKEEIFLKMALPLLGQTPSVAQIVKGTCILALSAKSFREKWLKSVGT